MRLFPRSFFSANVAAPVTELAARSTELFPSPASEEDDPILSKVGWLSAALGAVALGLIIGREIRLRYKFNRRTPYDLYAHSGDELPDVECGVGI